MTQSISNVVKLPVEKKTRRRAEDKFGSRVLKHGYTMLPNLLLSAQGRLDISPMAFNVLVQLIGHWWEADRNPYPAKQKIATRMGKSPRQVQRYLTELEKLKLIERIERFTGQKAQTSNEYNLSGLVEKLNQLEPEFAKLLEQKKIKAKRVETGAA